MVLRQESTTGPGPAVLRDAQNDREKQARFSLGQAAVVPQGDDLYIRSYKGRDGQWFRTALTSHEARIEDGGVDKEVTLEEETDAGINDGIDAAYLSKYRTYVDTHVPPMLTAEARSTTLRLVPKSATTAQ